MTRDIQRVVWFASALGLAVIFCNGAALAQPEGKGDQPQAKQGGDQGGMMGGQQGMGGMDMT